MTKSWARFAKAPGARFRSLMVTALRVTVTVVRSRRLDPMSDEAGSRREQSAQRVVAELLRLGPTYIKLGQVASCRPDILPAEYIEQLKVLQDDVPSDDFATVRATIEAELGRPLEQLFLSVQPVPLAAASLGQVHRATLFDGREVVIKVQRPFLKELYDTDLANIRKAATAADLISYVTPGRTAADRRRWRDFADEAKRLLIRELDYLLEASSQTQFRQNMAGEKWLAVPEVVNELTTSKVLTMEYLPGVKITDSAKLAKTAGIDTVKLSGRLAHAYLLQFCRDGFFHTDPHPGNIAVDTAFPGGRILLYDYGQCSSIEPNERSGILSVIKAILASDAGECMKAFDELGVISPRADRSKLQAIIEQNFATGRIGKKSAAGPEGKPEDKASGRGGEADYLQLSSIYTLVFRALAQMGGVGKSLNPNFEFINEVAPFVAEFDGVSFLVTAQLDRLGLRGLRQLFGAPAQLEDIGARLARWEAGSAPLQVRAAELEARLERVEKEGKHSQHLLVALAALQLALVTSARVPQLFAAAAALRWVVGLVRR
mmetsp:Transcript_45882/g.107184  ORF Transcript_45882/g.107184 Transcript_45882/m.107184 type:complete len:546 (+) Transcript_45882:314-1951(+)